MPLGTRMKKAAFLSLALALALAAPSQGAGWPHRKPGFWQVTISMPGGASAMMGMRKPMASKFCIDAASEADMLSQGRGAMQNMCSKTVVNFNGSTGTSDSVCHFGKSVQTSHT